MRIVTGEQLQKEFGHWHMKGEILNPLLVPECLRHLIPLAETYGLSDDISRENLLSRTVGEELKSIRQRVEEMGKDLDAWLAGPESEAETPSKEYVAFSALRMFVL